MKKLNHLLVAAAAVVAFGSVTLSTQAGETQYGNAKAREHAYSLRKVSGMGENIDLARGTQYGNAKAREIANSLRKVSGTGGNIDLAHAARPTLPAKDPRFETELRANAVAQFQIAPLK